MRKTLPESGDVRRREGFLLLPRSIERDWRWLEWATWREQYVEPYIYRPYWEATHWLDKETDDEC